MHHPIKCSSIRLRLATKRLKHPILCVPTNEMEPIASDAKNQRTLASLDLLLGSSSDEETIKSDVWCLRGLYGVVLGVLVMS